MASETAPVWRGSKSLRRSIVEISSLEPFPGNPRVGDVESIRASIARFGQVRPILVDGARIVAGHHFVLAATEEGWTHVAVTRNEFESEEEARAYLLADNRTAELGGIDDKALSVQLAAIQAGSTLQGTGYSEEDVKALERSLARLAQEPTTKPDDDVHVDYSCPVCLHGWSGSPRPNPLDSSDLRQNLEVVRKELGLATDEDAVEAAVREVARRLNLG